jgi:hypothetical protein
MCSQGAKQKLIFFTLFSLTMKYHAVDLSLVISDGLHNLLPSLWVGPRDFTQVMQAVATGNIALGDHDLMLKVAAYRLFQSLTLTTGFVDLTHPQKFPQKTLCG